MKLRTLGLSDLHVSPIGLGCWQFSNGAGLGGKYWPALPERTVGEIVTKSLAGGVNWFDTAEAYGGGESERALAAELAALGKTSNDVIVATKWWPVFRTSGSILSTIDERLARLRGFRIDLYQVHQPFGLSSVEKEMDAMARLVEQQKIRYIGVSNFNARRMRRADAQLRHHGLRLISNQVRYNLLHRSIETNGILDTAKELGISIIAYSPLAQGVLTGRYHQNHEALVRPEGVRKYIPDFSRRQLQRYRSLVKVLQTVAEAHDARPAQVALQWLLAIQGEMIVAIPGSTTPLQAREDAASMDLVLTRDELEMINEASKRCIRGGS